MARVKGTAISASLRFVEESFGDDGWRRVSAALSPDQRAALAEGILDSSWYPMDLLLAVMRAARETLGAQEPELVRRMGRASADYGIRGVYKIFFKVGSPQFIISRASRVFSSYYDEGEMRVVESGPGRAVLELTGFPGSPEFCDRILGWMERTVTLAGARNLVPLHSQCVHRGDPVCRFEGRWQ